MPVNNMFIFWITINPADLQYQIVIRLAISAKLKLSNKIKYVFWHKTMTVNLIPIAKFFHIICNAIFMILFDVNITKRRLLGPIKNQFGIFETNDHEMFCLHCFV